MELMGQSIDWAITSPIVKAKGGGRRSPNLMQAQARAEAHRMKEDADRSVREKTRSTRQAPKAEPAAAPAKKKRWSPKWGLLEPASPRTRAVVLGGAGAVTAGGLIAAHRGRKKSQRVEKSMDSAYSLRQAQIEREAFGKALNDPFEKAYRLDEGDASNVRIVNCVVPTGRHVGRANKLVRATGRKGAGGKATRLERYGR